MTIITNYKNHRIEADSWAGATIAIGRLMAEEAKEAALSDYRSEFPDLVDLGVSIEELSA